MTDPLAPISQTIATQLEELHTQAENYIRQAKADNTWRAYRADWADFSTWCSEKQLIDLPAAPATIVLYLTERARTHKTSTLQRRIAAIAQRHTGNKQVDPTKTPEVKECWRGIRRVKGTMPDAKTPAVTEIVRRLIDATPDTMQGARDRALILIGFAGAFRRSELIALNVEDLTFNQDGLIITLHRSKTDQEGAGRQIGITYGSNPSTCPVRTLADWLQFANIKAGPVFRRMLKGDRLRTDRLTAQSVALIIKHYVGRVGFDPLKFAGHSLRAGLATSAAAAGVGELAIMEQTGHRSLTMLRQYVRAGNLFTNNVSGKVGL